MRTPSCSQMVYARCGLAIMARGLGIELISLDAINGDRGLHGGEGMTDKQWEETSCLAMARLRALLQQGRSVVVDDTFRIASCGTAASKSLFRSASGFLVVFVGTPFLQINAT